MFNFHVLVGQGRILFVPAVGKLAAHVLEVVVAHVVDAKDDAVLVLGDAIADVLEELVLLLAALFRDLRQVEDLGAS